MATPPTQEEKVAGIWECKGIITILDGISTLFRNMPYNYREHHRVKVEYIEHLIDTLKNELKTLSESK